MNQSKISDNPAALVDKLTILNNTGRIWPEVPTNAFDKVALTPEAKTLVVAAVELCFHYNITPNCAIGGDDGMADSNIISLSEAEFDDLLKCLDRFMDD